MPIRLRRKIGKESLLSAFKENDFPDSLGLCKCAEMYFFQ